MDRQDLIDTLLGIDEEAFLALGAKDPKPTVVIVGGAAFILKELTYRQATHDIDVFEADQAAAAIIAQYPNVSGSVAAYSDQIPYSFEERVEPLDIGAKAINFVTPSTEDLIVMKLYSERPHDVQDMDAAARSGSVDWALLERLVEDEREAQIPPLSPRRYAEMKDAYRRFIERNCDELDL